MTPRTARRLRNPKSQFCVSWAERAFLAIYHWLKDPAKRSENAHWSIYRWLLRHTTLGKSQKRGNVGPYCCEEKRSMLSSLRTFVNDWNRGVVVM